MPAARDKNSPTKRTCVPWRREPSRYGQYSVPFMVYIKATEEFLGGAVPAALKI
jgi:hypothetical protein